jgi:hypothetical protein
MIDEIFTSFLECEALVVQHVSEQDDRQVPDGVEDDPSPLAICPASLINS